MYQYIFVDRIKDMNEKCNKLVHNMLGKNAKQSILHLMQQA